MLKTQKRTIPIVKKRKLVPRVFCAMKHRCSQMLTSKSVNRTPLGSRLSVERSAIFSLLKELCEDNAEYFVKVPTWTSYGERLVIVCNHIRVQSERLQALVLQLQEIAPNFDYDENTPGNGFRSLVCICDTAVLHIVSLLKVVTEQRGSFVFRLSHYCKEVESFASVVDFLVDALPKCIQNQLSISDSSLFPPLDSSYDQYYEMLRGLEQLDSTCFYGRPLGFQFSPSVNRIFRFIGIVLASYSLSWEKGHGPIGSIINTGRFFLSPEQRASRIIKVTKEADIQFCKGFWNLSELSNNMPKFFCPNMAINELRSIDHVGPIKLETTDGDMVDIAEPSAHTGPRPVQIRVLSPVHREHMSPSNASGQQPPSPYIVIHCHGGGYVATSSKSHETYLRVWAKLLNCTVVSVEYSLAPENPYPRPTEEVLYSYAWIVNNPHLFGWTGEKICMVGDSAGGNLIMSACLRLIQLKVKKRPDGIVPVYTPFLFQYLPSPSRVLSVMDPLLHMGVVLRCVAAYTGGYGKGATEQGENSASHKSLQEYVEQVQKNQRIDFTGGPHSIVSLVQNMHHIDKNDNGIQNPEIGSFFVENDKKEADSESDDEVDTRSVSSVQIDADPLHIQLSSTVFDNQLLEFIMHHPTTKNALIFDENSEVIEEAEDALLSQMNENERKRPRILNFGRGTSATVPSTPVDQVKPIPNSVSNQAIQKEGHKRSLSQSLADTAALAAGHAYDNLQEWLTRPSKEKTKLDRTTSHKEPPAESEEEPACEKSSHILDLLDNVTVPRDPLISPMYADDNTLRQLPPCYFVACHLDPLLDDTIAFSKKLRNAGGIVKSVDLLPSVPHGFLNFTLMSPECRQGAKVCIQRIKEALGFEETG